MVWEMCIRDRIYHEPLAQAENVEFRWNSVVSALLSGYRLTGVRLRDTVTGEERYTKFRDENGVPKIRYTYCSLHGKLFNCVCRSTDEAQRLCEDWLVTQDRCYIN